MQRKETHDIWSWISNNNNPPYERILSLEIWFWISCFAEKSEILLSKIKFRFPSRKHSIISLSFVRKLTMKCDSITYRSWSDFTPHNDIFSSGSALLFLALFVTFKILPSMRALLIDCHKNTAVCLEEIMKELAQVRFEVNILAESRTSLRCK